MHFSLSLKYEISERSCMRTFSVKCSNRCWGSSTSSLPTKSVYTTNFDPSGPDLPCAEWLTGEKSGQGGPAAAMMRHSSLGSYFLTNAAIAAGSCWVRSLR